MNSRNDSGRLKRPLQSMPGWVSDALVDAGLGQAYRDRPPYQRNDYLSWINRAVRDATKRKRLHQMLAELEAGDVYMGMEWHPRRS